jgi:D-glycero-beta-D-manno-heptose-7-phosphate kinase
VIAADRYKKIVSSFASLSPILVVGDVGLDKYIFGQVRRISPEAPVPVLEVKRQWDTLGMAANISYNLQALEIDSLLCGTTGLDQHAERIKSILLDSGMASDGIVQLKGRETICKERVVTKTQQICRIDYENVVALDQSMESELLARVEELGEQSKAIILEDYGKGVLTKRVLQQLISKHREAKNLVCVDPGRQTPPDFYRGASLLKPNLDEAMQMVHYFGYKDGPLEEMAAILLDKLSLDMVLITLGADGMAMLDRDNGELKIIPTAATEVYDVSGAGDTAIALITASLLAGASLEEAAWIGNCASGVVIAKRGTATVTRSELDNFYLRLQETLQANQ